MIKKVFSRISKKHFFMLLLIIAVGAAVHHKSFSYYFFQDDWFVINWVKSENLVSFFKFRTDIIYYRPLSMPVLYGLAYKLFGLNTFGFHLIGFSIYAALIVCVYKLISLLRGNAKLAVLGAFLYATWHIHYMSLSWFSTTSYLLGPLLDLLSFIFFIQFTKKRRQKLYLASFISFTLSLLASEFALMIPLIIFSWGLILKRKSYIKYLLPYFIIDAAFIFLRFVIFPVPAENSYKIILGGQVITNYVWYILWAFGLPESFKDLLTLQDLKQSLKVILQFWLITLPAILLFVSTALSVMGKIKNSPSICLFSFVFFTLGLLPVLTTVNHSYALYLSLSGIGLILLILSALGKSANSTIAVFAVIWLFANLQTLNFNRFTHWITNEQAISKAYVTLMKSKYQNVLPDAYFLIRPPDVPFSQKNRFAVSKDLTQVRQALNDQDAVKVIYSNSSLKTVYAAYDDKVSIPQNAPLYTIDPGI